MMNQICVSAALALASLSLVGCQACTICGSGSGADDVDAAAQAVAGNEFTDKAALGQLSMLDGDWQFIDENGDDVDGLMCTFNFTSNNSVVREVMFPGGDNEMTNLYHMDGQSIVCTHYCAAGNQPRMVATGMQTGDDGTSFDFKLDSVSNLRPEHDHFMGGMKLVFTDDNTLEQHWTSFKQDGEVAGEMVFVMKRVD
jgi:hypothetical protein